MTISAGLLLTSRQSFQPLTTTPRYRCPIYKLFVNRIKASGVGGRKGIERICIGSELLFGALPSQPAKAFAP